MTRRYGIGIAAVTLMASAALASTAFAQVNVGVGVDANANVPGMSANAQMNGRVTGGPQDQSDRRGDWDGRPGMRIGQMQPGVFGTVTAINGTTLTVSGHAFAGAAVGQRGQRPAMSATTTYAVDASAATVVKNNATSSLSSVAVNDRVFVVGAVSGSNVTAVTIRDGIPGMMGRRPGNNEGGPAGQDNLPVKGNGQPVVAGTVSSVNGSTITITTSSNTSFTIDASTATIMKGNSTSTVSSVSTGDYIVVQGAVNGSSVTASSVIDGKAGVQVQHPGVMTAIAQFFKHLFGF